MNGIRLSLCIPTYNGQKTIANTLDSIVGQCDYRTEIVVSDDKSTDDTVRIVEGYRRRYSNIRLYTNERNLGMDRNFERVAILAHGQFTWLFGQDDELKAGTVDHVLRLLADNPEVGIVYVNYAQYNHDMSVVTFPSMLHRQVLSGKALLESKEWLVFQDAQEYFRMFESLPSFLPATVIKREFWERTDISTFYDTAYAQVALMICNIANCKIAVVTEPLVKGRVPIDRWQSNGADLFKVNTGYVLMLSRVARRGSCPIPARILRVNRLRYALNFLFLVCRAKLSGFVPTSRDHRKVREVYGLFWTLLYFSPILLIPKHVCGMVYGPLTAAKRGLVRILSVALKGTLFRRALRYY